MDAGAEASGGDIWASMKADGMGIVWADAGLLERGSAGAVQAVLLSFSAALRLSLALRSPIPLAMV